MKIKSIIVAIFLLSKIAFGQSNDDKMSLYIQQYASTHNTIGQPPPDFFRGITDLAEPIAPKDQNALNQISTFLAWDRVTDAAALFSESEKNTIEQISYNISQQMALNGQRPMYLYIMTVPNSFLKGNLNLKVFTEMMDRTLQRDIANFTNYILLVVSDDMHIEFKTLDNKYDSEIYNAVQNQLIPNSNNYYKGILATSQFIQNTVLGTNQITVKPNLLSQLKLLPEPEPVTTDNQTTPNPVTSSINDSSSYLSWTDFIFFLLVGIAILWLIIQKRK